MYGTAVNFPAGAESLLFTAKSRVDLVPTQLPTKRKVGFRQGVNWPKHEAYESQPFSAKANIAALPRLT